MRSMFLVAMLTARSATAAPSTAFGQLLTAAGGEEIAVGDPSPVPTREGALAVATFSGSDDDARIFALAEEAGARGRGEAVRFLYRLLVEGTEEEKRDFLASTRRARRDRASQSRKGRGMALKLLSGE